MLAGRMGGEGDAVMGYFLWTQDETGPLASSVRVNRRTALHLVDLFYRESRIGACGHTPVSVGSLALSQPLMPADSTFTLV